MEKCSDVPEVTISGDAAYWFELKDFDALFNCNNIKLIELRLTLWEVRMFLKKWVESSTLKNVDMTVKGVNVLEAVKGLPARRQQKELTYFNGERELNDCFEVQRDDGVKARIWFQEGKFNMRTHQ